MWVSGKTKNIAFQLVLILQQCCKTNDFVPRLTVALMEREKREGSRRGGGGNERTVGLGFVS